MTTLWEEEVGVGVIRFHVHGTPVAQGSKKTVPAGGRWVSVETNLDRLKPWRNDVADAAYKAIGGQPLHGPVSLRASFIFPRPKNHFGTGRNAGRVKDSAPGWKDSAPDLDKLLRALGDALTGIVVADDSQFVDVAATKIWGQTPGVTVEVRPLA